MTVLSRRNFLKNLAGAGIAGLSAPAYAQDVLEFFLQEQLRKRSGWDNRFDDTARGAVPVKSDEPMFTSASAVNIQRAIRQHQDMQARGGWEQVPASSVMRLGVRHDHVSALRRRLIASGDLLPETGTSDIFDSYVDSAVRRFQQRHGIIANGVVRKDTFLALNTPIGYRIRQLETNLVRVREIVGEMQDSNYVMVNIPAATLEAVDMSRVHSRHTAIVGKVDRQTPLLSSKIHELNFNPYWTVPVSIIRKDLIPKMQQDPGYLARNNIRIYDWRTKQELSPSQIDWNTEQATEYMFRQDPGEINSLGTVKINFHNKHSVYMHDTPTKSLFGEDYRFLSSGCVRVQNIRELITWILRNDADYNRAAVDSIIASGEQKNIAIQKPVPLHFRYVTAWSTSDGVVNFREDIYNRDGLPTLAQNG
jgi:murein L,D-transpeptidase YcbB/YkuD